MLVRVPQFRGAQVAAGVVVLTTLALLLEVRMGQWSPGAHLVCSGGLGVLVWTLVIGTPPAEGRPRPWLGALCLSAVALLVVSVGHVVDLLGSSGFYDAGRGDNPARTITLSALVVCAAATWCARARAAAACALVAGVAGTVALLEFADWIANPGLTTARWLLVFAAFVLLVLTLVQRDSTPAHAAQWANAGGLAIAVIGLVAAFDSFFASIFSFAGDARAPQGLQLGTGWELLLLAAGFGLMAYGAIDGQRGPVVVGLLNTALFVAAAALPEHDFVGWPIFLLAAGLGLLVIGLRPTTPAPPEPGGDVEPPPPIDVRLER
jgi:hypothetical protein